MSEFLVGEMIQSVNPYSLKLSELTVFDVGTLLDATHLHVLKKAFMSCNVSGILLTVCENLEDIQQLTSPTYVINGLHAKALLKKLNEWMPSEELGSCLSEIVIANRANNVGLQSVESTLEAMQVVTEIPVHSFNSTAVPMIHCAVEVPNNSESLISRFQDVEQMVPDNLLEIWHDFLHCDNRDELHQHTPLIVSAFNSVAIISSKSYTHANTLLQNAMFTESFFNLVLIYADLHDIETPGTKDVCLKSLQCIIAMCSKDNVQSSDRSDSTKTNIHLLSQFKAMDIIGKLLFKYHSRSIDILRTGLDAYIPMLTCCTQNQHEFYNYDGDKLILQLLHIHNRDVTIVKRILTILNILIHDMRFVDRLLSSDIFALEMLNILTIYRNSNDDIVQLALTILVRITDTNTVYIETIIHIDYCTICCELFVRFVQTYTTQTQYGCMYLLFAFISKLSCFDVNCDKFLSLNLFGNICTFLSASLPPKHNSKAYVLIPVAVKCKQFALVKVIITTCRGHCLSIDTIPIETLRTMFTSPEWTDLLYYLIASMQTLTNEKYGHALFKLAVTTKSFDMLMEIVTKCDLNVIHMKDIHLEDGSSVIFHACASNNIKLVRKLLELGCSLETPSLTGCIACEVATYDAIIKLINETRQSKDVLSRQFYLTQEYNYINNHVYQCPPCWHSFVYYLSDHVRSIPTDLFVLFIFWDRDTEENVYYKVYLRDKHIVWEKYRKRDNEIDYTFRKTLFGTMEYTCDMKPRYYCDVATSRWSNDSSRHGQYLDIELNSIIAENNTYSFTDFLLILSNKLYITILNRFNYHSYTRMPGLVSVPWTVYEILQPDTAQERARIRRNSLDVDDFFENREHDSNSTQLVAQVNDKRFKAAIDAECEDRISFMISFGYTNFEMYNRNGWTAEMITTKYMNCNLLKQIIDVQHPHMKRTMCFQSDHSNTMGKTVLHCAVLNGNTEAVHMILHFYHSSGIIKVSDEKGFLPHHYASENGMHEALYDILSRDCSHTLVNAQTNSGRTALHLAVAMGHIEVVKVLLEFKADPHISDTFDKMPLNYAESRNESEPHLQIIDMLKTNVN